MFIKKLIIILLCITVFIMYCKSRENFTIGTGENGRDYELMDVDISPDGNATAKLRFDQDQGCDPVDAVPAPPSTDDLCIYGENGSPATDEITANTARYKKGVKSYYNPGDISTKRGLGQTCSAQYPNNIAAGPRYEVCDPVDETKTEMDSGDTFWDKPCLPLSNTANTLYNKNKKGVWYQFSPPKYGGKQVEDRGNGYTAAWTDTQSCWPRNVCKIAFPTNYQTGSCSWRASGWAIPCLSTLDEDNTFTSPTGDDQIWNTILTLPKQWLIGSGVTEGPTSEPGARVWENGEIKAAQRNALCSNSNADNNTYYYSTDGVDKYVSPTSCKINWEKATVEPSRPNCERFKGTVEVGGDCSAEISEYTTTSTGPYGDKWDIEIECGGDNKRDYIEKDALVAGDIVRVWRYDSTKYPDACNPVVIADAGGDTSQYCDKK